MPIARDINETWTHILKREEGRPDAVEFILGLCRDPATEARALDLTGSGKGFEGAHMALRGGGLRGWRGCRDKDGNEVKFRGKGAATDADLSLIGPFAVAELGGAVLMRNQLTEAESD